MSMKIKNIKIDNLRNVEIFEWDFWEWNVISGDNGAGKSTVIDGIFGAIRGKTYFWVEPCKLIKIWEDSAKIQLTIWDEQRDLEITREFTPWTEKKAWGYDKLTVKDSKGWPLDQKTLTSFFWAFTIDPLLLARQTPKAQIDTVKDIAKIDTSEVEKQAKEFYEQRTIENREEKRLLWLIASEPEKVEEVSLQDLLKEKQKVEDHNAVIHWLNVGIERNEEWIMNCEERIKDYQKQIKEFEESIEDEKAAIEVKKENQENFRKEIKDKWENNPELLEKISEKIKNSEDVNAKARKYKEFIDNKKKHTEQKTKCDTLTEKYEEKLKERETIIKKANLPEWVWFDKNIWVTVNWIPFTQLNTAEQIKVSIWIASGLAPELKVLHIKDWSLLDNKTLEEVKKICSDSDYQILVERVWEDEDLSTIVMREWQRIK